MGRPRKMRRPPKRSLVEKAEKYLNKHRSKILKKTGIITAEAIVATAFPEVAMIIYGTTALPR